MPCAGYWGVNSQLQVRMKFLTSVFLCFPPTDTSCSSSALVHRLCCQEPGRVTPWRLELCTRLRPGLSLAAAWPDHCLPSTSLIAAATGSVQPCPRRSSPSPWPCCSHTSSVSSGAHTGHRAPHVCPVRLHETVCPCLFWLYFWESTLSKTDRWRGQEIGRLVKRLPN